MSVVLGSQWGDEGKGKLVDLLSGNVDMVARCQGGNNAGHTVVAEGVAYAFHLLPSGLAHEKVEGILGNGVVVHVGELLGEIEANEAKGLAAIGPDRLKVSDRAHLVFDMHRQADGRQEEERTKSKTMLGTTKKGIGPAYASKSYRSGIRMGDLVGHHFDAYFAARFKRLAEDHVKAFNVQVDIEAEIERYRVLADKIRPFVTETVSYVHKALEQGRKILVEGANASMLDIDFGTYPYVTSSNCSIGGVCTGLGIPPGYIGHVYGVVKAYTTRVGAGEFPTELPNELGDYLQKTGAEFGVTTGRKRRCGWLDIPMLKFTSQINGFTALALTKLDIFDDLDEIKIGAKYLKDGQGINGYPGSEQDYDGIQVEYVTMGGWKQDISGCRTFEELPENARKYVATVQQLIGVPIWWVGVGQARDAIINRVPT